MEPATFPFLDRMYYVYQRDTMREKNLLEEIVHKHYRRVFAYCLAILMNRERAEDACHDVFLKVHGSIGSLDRSRDCTPWLLRIARNHCYDIIRKERRLLDCEHFEAFLRDDSPGPEDSLLEQERLSAVHRAMGQLETAYREVMVLRDVEGLSYQSIASHLGFERKRVKWMLHKARQRVKHMIGDWDA